MLERRIAAVVSSTKPRLVEECHNVGVTGNINVPKATLVARLIAFYRAQAREMAALIAAPQGRRSEAVAAAGAFLPIDQSLAVPRRLPVRSSARVAARGAADVPGSSSHEAPPASPRLAAPLPSTPPSRSPSPPPGKRLRSEATPFSPATSPRCQGSPDPRRLVPLHARVILDPLDARRRSHASAAVRPARLDELLELQSDVRRRQLCLRGLADSVAEGASDLAGMVGRPIAVADCVRAGRYKPDRPRPVILRFATLAEKLEVLRAKSVLYTEACPAQLRGIHVYHDLSGSQLDWKSTLR